MRQISNAKSSYDIHFPDFLLLSWTQGYEVHGIIRRSSSFNTQRIDHIYRDRHESAVRLKLHYGDLTDSTNLMHIIYEVSPYNNDNSNNCKNEI